MTELLPCRCGSNNTYVGGSGEGFAGFCSECNAAGLTAAHEEAAAARWNDSVSDSTHAPA